MKYKSDYDEGLAFALGAIIAACVCGGAVIAFML